MAYVTENDVNDAERTTPARRTMRARATAALLVAFGAMVLPWPNVAVAQDVGAAPPTRAELVLGEGTPLVATEYHGDFKDANAITPTERVVARVPGLPVRQHPVNTGLYQTAGCQQCHRLAGPIPQNAGAPPDVFDQLPAQGIDTPAPERFTRLTTSDTRDEYPTWSPNGHHLLYETRDPNGHYNLWLTTPNGTHPRQITHHQAAGWATWNPQNTHIAYWASDTPQTSNIWIHDLQTGTNTQLTHHTQTAWPQWNPTGQWLTYQAKNPNQGWTLHLHNPTTNQHHTLTTHDTLPSRPLWNPNGTQILYQALSGPGFELVRLVFPLGDDGEPDLTATPRRSGTSTTFPVDLSAATQQAAWHPSRDRIAFLTYTRDVLPNDQYVFTYKTWTISQSGTHAAVALPSGTLGDRSPTWSPDGRWIAQWSWTPDYTAGIWLVNPETRRSIELTADLGGDALYPAWSPDGTMVAFAANREGSFDIWIADVEDLVGATPGASPEATNP